MYAQCTGFDTNISFPTTLSLFSFSVLVPLTRHVYKPATTILSLQSEVEKQRNNPQDNNCPPTNPPTGPDSTSQQIQNTAKQGNAGNYSSVAPLEELWTHLPSQREDPFRAKMDRRKDEWMDKRMPGGEKG